jgi:hypothetical protein
MKYTNPVTLQDAIDYLHFGLATFEHDPADTDFQRGYEQALRDMRADLLGWPYVHAKGRRTFAGTSGDVRVVTRPDPWAIPSTYELRGHQ